MKTDEHDIEDDARRLGEQFAAVPPPRALDEGRWQVAGERRGGPARVVGKVLIGAPGERRLRPLAAALLVPVLVLAVAGGFGLRARLASSSGGSAPNPEARAAAAMAFDAAHGDVVMFGGHGMDGFLDDTWTWDGSSWTRQHPAASPPAMQSALMAADPVTGRMLLAGTPRQSTGPGVDTWTWDGSSWRQEHPAHRPPQSGALTMAADPAHHQVVMVVPPMPEPVPQGTATPAPVGFGEPRVTPLIVKLGPAETWTWNGSDWVRRPDDAAPGVVTSFRLAWEEQSHRLLMFGQASSFCMGAVAGGTLHGGPVTSGSAPSGPAVVVPATTPHAMPATTPHALPVDPPPSPAVAPHPVPAMIEPALSPTCLRNGDVLPPGAPASAPSIACTACQGDQLWSWDGSAWRGVSLQGAPSPLHAADVVDDPSSGGVLVDAGGSAWTITGSAVHAGHASGPLPRSQPAMAGDRAHHDVVLFGGFAAQGMAADTWTWDGRSWTHRAGPLRPVPAQPTLLGHPIAGSFVPERPQCVMSGTFGGTQSGARNSDRFTYAFPWPSGACASQPVTVTVVDDAGRAVDVNGNGRTVQPGPELTFTWSNWCGERHLLLQLDWKSQSSLDSIIPPACSNRSAPSTLVFPVPTP